MKNTKESFRKMRSVLGLADSHPPVSKREHLCLHPFSWLKQESGSQVYRLNVLSMNYSTNWWKNTGKLEKCFISLPTNLQPRKCNISANLYQRNWKKVGFEKETSKPPDARFWKNFRIHQQKLEREDTNQRKTGVRVCAPDSELITN